MNNKAVEQFPMTAIRIANMILLAGAAVCALAVGYVLYHYDWTGDRQVIGLTGTLLYYWVPAGLCIFLVYSVLRFKPSSKINLTLALLSVAVSVWIGELVVRFSASTFLQGREPAMSVVQNAKDRRREAAKLEAKFGVQVDTRDGSEALNDLHRQGIDAVPIIATSNALFMPQQDGSIKSAINVQGSELIPLGAISNHPTLFCNESGSYVTYESDEHGFRNPKGLWNAGSVEIAALGDSFAQGYCVGDDENFVGLVRRAYPSTLNLGMAGEGPLLMLATFKEYVEVLKPKLVLWFYFEGNDLENLHTERKSLLLTRYLEHQFSQNLSARQDEIDTALIADIPREAAVERNLREARETTGHVDNLQEIVKLSALRKKLGLISAANSEDFAIAKAVSGPETLDLFGSILSRVKEDAAGWGGKVWFIYLPSPGRFLGQPEIGDKQRERVLTEVQTLGIPIIDLLPLFESQPDPLSSFPFRQPGHYNKAGHQLVGNKLLEVLAKDCPHLSRRSE
jgi:hypothetical protein